MAPDNGTVTINDGTFTSISSTAGKLTVNGGVVSANVIGGAASIFGGEVKALKVSGDAYVYVGGGKFTGEEGGPTVDGGELTTDDDGNVTVTPYVTKDNNGEKYTSLQEAVNAEDVTAVTLLRDIELPASVVILKPVSIDGAGHSIKAAETFNVSTGLVQYDIDVSEYPDAEVTIENVTSVARESENSNGKHQALQFRGDPKDHGDSPDYLSGATVTVKGCTFDG